MKTFVFLALLLLTCNLCAQTIPNNTRLTHSVKLSVGESTTFEGIRFLYAGKAKQLNASYLIDVTDIEVNKAAQHFMPIGQFCGVQEKNGETIRVYLVPDDKEDKVLLIIVWVEGIDKG